MNKKYIVKAQGKVFDVQDTAYAIVASSKNEAETIARERFLDEYPVIDGQFRAQASNKSFATVISLITLSISLIPTFFGWKDGHDLIYISPRMISCLFGIGFYAAYLVRFKGITNMFQSWTDLVFCPLLVLLFSSFFNAVGQGNLKIFFWETSINASLVMIVALILSWLGLKLVSVACMLIVFFLAIARMLSLDAAMGPLAGPIYVICAFIGLVSYMSTEPAFYQGTLGFGKTLSKSAFAFRNDFNEAKTIVADKGSKVIDAIKKGGE